MADAQQVIDYLAGRIAQLEVDKAVLLSDLATTQEEDSNADVSDS